MFNANMHVSNECMPMHGLWAARYNTWLLIELTPKGVVFSFLVCFHAWAASASEAAVQLQ